MLEIPQKELDTVQDKNNVQAAALNSRSVNKSQHNSWEIWILFIFFRRSLIFLHVFC